jgi:ABC-2 type transport system permease protein
MTAIVDNARIFRYSAISAWQDFRREYSVLSWIGEWAIRIVFQVTFFALIGKLLNSNERVEYLLIGNSVMVASMTVMYVVQTTVWERWTGTLPLLVAAPASPLVVFMGRSVEWIPDAVLSSMIGLFLVGPIFNVSLPWPEAFLVIPLVLLVTVSTYMMGAFLGSLALRTMESRNLIANTAHGLMMAVCGVNVPTSFFPEWVQGFSAVLPLTHGLNAIRGLLAQESEAYIWTNIQLEILVGLGWRALALATFRWLAEGGRKDGSIEFGS